MNLEESEDVCVDGVYRGNIDINNRDEESKMSILAKYVNCSVVEGSISITSAVYSNDDTNYSMPNLIEVSLPAFRIAWGGRHLASVPQPGMP
jgi:hypothetical protein